MECIAVSYGYGTEEELKNAHPFKIVNSAEEILDFSPEPQKKTENAGFGMEVSVSGGNPFCAFPACLLSGTVFSGAADWRRYECILPACAYADWSDRDFGCSSCILLYRGDFSRRKETGILYPAADRHLPVPEILGFLIIGAFLGQYGNILVGLFQQYLNPEAYQETQSLISEGKVSGV